MPLAAKKSHNPSDTIVAARIRNEIPLNAARPNPAWNQAFPATFCSDWLGHHTDLRRKTEVRLLWTPATLYLRFVCSYRELFVFEDSDPSGRRDRLWNRDVAEAFLQPEPARVYQYKEFEVSPNGMWIDLDIFPGGRSDLKSGLVRSIRLDQKRKTWVAEMAIPMAVLTRKFNPSEVWRANFYRVEGAKEPRFYSAWQATKTPQPNFHVPQAFGKLRFGQGD